MGVQPGWYQDPEGPAGQPRYWDGTGWAPGLGGTAATARGAGKPAPRMWTAPLVIVAVIGVMLGFGYWLLPEVLTSRDTSSVPTGDQWGETSSTAAGPTAEWEEVGPLDCAGAGSENLPKGPELRVAGIVVPFPDESWGFRFDPAQWPWLHDLHAWGSIDIEPRGEGWAAGIVAGRLEASNGFGDPEQAAAAVVECLLTHGAFNTGEEMVDTVSEAVTIGGMPAWSMTMAYPEEGTHGATVVRVLTIDAGRPASLAAVIGFYPQGDQESGLIVQHALDGITRQWPSPHPRFPDWTSTTLVTTLVGPGERLPVPPTPGAR